MAIFTKRGHLFLAPPGYQEFGDAVHIFYVSHHRRRVQTLPADRLSIFPIRKL